VKDCVFQKSSQMTPRVFIPLAVLALLAACAPGPEPANRSVSYPLATPVSQLPAAGICASFEGTLVTVTIFPGYADPRCTTVRPDQNLQIINRTLAPLQVHIGTFSASLDPGADYSFRVPFGKYLAPGVHQVQVLPCCGPELWLQTESP